MSKVTKLYAAYKAGYLGDNILDTYFSFIATIIYEEKLNIIEDTAIAAKLKERYEIEFPLPFVRQVLTIGIKNKSFVYDCGKYSVMRENLSNYCFDGTEFNTLWESLIAEFTEYCQKEDIDISSLNVGDFILDILDETDEKILSGEKVELNTKNPSLEYAWYSFTKHQGVLQTKLYSFISAISASNITKQALFYMGETKPDYSGLNIYLDSPIIFALLGMDEEARTASYKTLLEDMLKAKCGVYIFDHNFQEIEGILARACHWATNIEYDLRKANRATRYFHDKGMSVAEIKEFCAFLEEKLKNIGVTVKTTSYDITNAKFQEDEAQLFNMIESRYSLQGMDLLEGKKESIQKDVRSIIMVYRERRGQTATRLKNAKHIMLTSNNVIANVSKKYESNQSVQSGHIPACISADLFGAVLWLNSPLRLQEYQKQKVLADCYSFLKPSKVLLDKYIQSLEEARKAEAIDEKKFLFLLTHSVVLDSLMDVTKGDYAHFTSSTYIEVYNDIQAKAMKVYKDEAAAHQKTSEELKLQKNRAEDAEAKTKEKELEIQKLHNTIADLEAQEKRRQEEEFNKRAALWGRVATVLVFLILYLPILVTIEILISRLEWQFAYERSAQIIAGAIDGGIFTLGGKLCRNVVRNYLKKNGK